MGLGQPVLGRVLRSVCAAVFDGHHHRLENLLMVEYRTFEYDVLVIGAGGAGLRAAIEASAAGGRVGLILQSNLGKRHTVIGEGGSAAALSTPDSPENWRVHFPHTIRGSPYVNNLRQAQLHA